MVGSSADTGSSRSVAGVRGPGHHTRMAHAAKPPDSDLYDPASEGFANRATEIYRVLRDEHPLYRDEARGRWVLTRYDDVREAASKPDLLSSEGTSISLGLLPMIQQMDPPRHHALRALLAKAFTPNRVAAMESRVRELTAGLLDDLLARERCDLLHDFAAQLPSLVIGELIGIPPERREAFLEWTSALISANPHKNWDRNPFESIYAEFATLLDERRARREADLMSALLDAELDGQRLSQEELLGFCFLLVVGGNDTTTNLIANGLVLLAHHPDARTALRADEALIPGAVEEMLRIEAPTQALPRIATSSFEMYGRTIEAGDEVSLVWGAANHDERRFPEPERFDIHRSPNPHLALGHGVHFCMGAHLARLEGRVAMEEMLRRAPDYALAEEPGWLPSAWARAYRAVPARLRP